MSYETEFARLQRIIVSDGSEETQRTTAREAQKVLVDNRLSDLFGEFEDRTAQYEELIGRIAAVVDRIHANELSGVIDDLGAIVTDVQEAAQAARNG